MTNSENKIVAAAFERIKPSLPCAAKDLVPLLLAVPGIQTPMYWLGLMFGARLVRVVGGYDPTISIRDQTIDLVNIP